MVIIEAAVKIIAYTLIFVGIWRLSYPFWIDSYRLQVQKARLRKHVTLANARAEERKSNRLHQHIQSLVFALSKRNGKQKVWNFYYITLGLFISTLCMLILLGEGLFLSMSFATFIAVIPYGLLRFRLASIRVKASHAFMKEFHVFLQLYQQERDVYFSVMEASQKIRDKRLRLAFRRILSSMQKERTEEAFRGSMNLFAFTVGSSFAARFSSIMIKAYRDQVDVSEALLELHVDLRKREKDISQLKTKRMETILLGFMPLGLLPLYLWIGSKMLVIYSTAFVFDQTNMITGFIISLLFAIASALAAYLLSRPKADF